MIQDLQPYITNMFWNFDASLWDEEDVGNSTQ